MTSSPSCRDTVGCFTIVSFRFSPAWMSIEVPKSRPTHLLKVQFVSWPHDHDLGALRVKDNGGCRNPPARAGGPDFEPDVDEHSREHPVRLVGDIDLRQECPRAQIERAGGSGHGGRYRFMSCPRTATWTGRPTCTFGA